MKGRLIVIEGIDGSGKATQAKLLHENLIAKGEKAVMVTFPDYESPSSAMVKMYLSGAFGEDPDSVNPYAASCFFACDRYASYKTKWQQVYEDGGIIIADRYTTSNAVHQCSKLEQSKWDSYLEWLFEFEYKYIGIPEPDMVVYLRVDPEKSRELINVRYEGDDSKKDIHENNMDFLKKSKLTADYCAEKFGWYTIDCISDFKMRSASDICRDIVDGIEILIK